METTDQINLFKEFVETTCYSELLKNIANEDFFLHLDFVQLSLFNPELAEVLLEHPEDVVKAAELAIKGFDLGVEIKHFRVRLLNLPSTTRIAVRNIRAKHIGRLITNFWYCPSKIRCTTSGHHSTLRMSKLR